MSTRSSRPELEGPLPTPKRPSRKGSALRSSVVGGPTGGDSSGSQGEVPEDGDALSKYVKSRGSVDKAKIIHIKQSDEKESHGSSPQARQKLESLHGSPSKRLLGRAQSRATHRAREPESCSLIPPPEGIRVLHGGMEPMDGKEKIVSTGEKLQQENSPSFQPSSKKPDQMGLSYEDDKHSRASLRPDVVDKDFVFHMFDNLYGNLATLHSDTSNYYKNTNSKIVDATTNMIATAVSRALKMSEEYFIKIPEFRQKFSQTDEKTSEISRHLESVE